MLLKDSLARPFSSGLPLQPDHVSSATRGRRLLIVGGDCRQHHVRRLQATLGFSQVTWCSTRETCPAAERLRHLIVGGAFDVVVALVGLMRHQHFADTRRLCAEAGIRPIVLYRSPSPSRLLHEIVTPSFHSDSFVQQI